MKEFLLHKLTLRIAAFSAVFLSTKILLLLNGKFVHNILINIFVDPTIKPGADEYLKTSLGLLITIGGAFLYHWIHEKFILPHVDQTTEAEKKGETKS